ncbi:MAG: T9SS type A sorting domain-containing protein [Flavobacteriales bacterium]|nr:T9SS type A sorting domain-containing protein [Flavobacteriales bacterium]
MLKQLAFTAALALSLGAQAQLPIVDIALVPNASNQLEVIIRPDAEFDGFFAAVVFTIRWQDSDGANLGSIIQDPDVQDYMNVNKSGPEQVSGPHRYQVFSGFGGSPLFDIQESWSPGEEIVLCKVNILNGSSFFSLSDDAFTTSLNGNFFVSLNGQNRTGEIYSFTTSVAEEDLAAGAWVGPNPTPGPVDLVLASDGPSRVEIFDGAGRLVKTEQFTAVAGERHAMDLAPLMNGTYVLRITNNGVVEEQRLVVVH